MDNRTMMALGDELNRTFDRLVEIQGRQGLIDRSLYNQYDVKQGLRDTKTGRGVLTGLLEGLTNIG